MVDKRNSTDANFPFDSSLQNDHLKEDNAIIASDNEIRLMLMPNLVQGIGNGLTIADGTGVNTVRVGAGWAIDDIGRKVTLSAVVDNIADADTTGGWNYVAIRYSNLYSAPRVARGNGVEYNTTISDSYTLDVSAVQQPLGAPNYWIRLGRFIELTEFSPDTTQPTYRTYNIMRKSDTLSFWWGNINPATGEPRAVAVPPMAALLKSSAGCNLDLFRVPYSGYIHRIYVQSSIAPVAAVDFQGLINGAPLVGFGASIGAAATTDQHDYDPSLAAASFAFNKGDTIGTQADCGGGPSAAIQAVCNLAVEYIY